VKEIRRVDVAVGKRIVPVIGDVIEPQTNCPAIAQPRGLPFEMQVESKVARELPIVRLTDLPSFIIVGREPETIPPFQEIDNSVVLGDREEPPAEQPVGRIPRQSAGQIREDDRFINADVESRIRKGPRSCIT
jgi:hypothetical protein